jgi:glycosyltransferase involved in cell wall biosynthesis
MSLHERHDGEDNSTREETIVKIGQIAPLWKSVSVRMLSEQERALSYLTEELVRRGHEVTLFASADSRTSAKLEVLSETQFSRTPANWNLAGAALMAAEQAFGKRADEFDIIHSYFGIDGFPMARRCPTPTLTTLQDRLDFPAYAPVFKEFQNLPLVSTSNAQRRPLAWASWLQTIYPGVPSALYRLNPRPGKYLAFIGSLSLEEGLGLAIELARRAHLPLRVAPRQDDVDGLPLSIPIELLNENPGIEWLGELREEEKNDFLGGALALVCTHDWPGPSALSVVEALACGTPVVTLHGGTAEEMICDHVTGFACENLDEMVEVLPLIWDLDREECRSSFEKRFSAERMTDHYLLLYERLIGLGQSPRLSSPAAIPTPQPDTRPVTV